MRKSELRRKAQHGDTPAPRHDPPVAADLVVQRLVRDLWLAYSLHEKIAHGRLDRTHSKLTVELARGASEHLAGYLAAWDYAFPEEDAVAER